jgi:hypothetical protein
MLDDRFEVVSTFPGTVGGGELTIYRFKRD